MSRGRRAEGFPSHIVYIFPNKKKKKKKRIYKVGTYDRRIRLINIETKKRITVMIPAKEKVNSLTPEQKLCMRKHLNDIVEYHGEQYRITRITHC